MAVTTTTGKVNINESLDQVVHITANDETPFIGSLKKQAISHRQHEWIIEDRNPASLDNAAVEGAEFVDSSFVAPIREINHTQIFTKVVHYSDTYDAVSTVGGQKESVRKLVDAGVEMKRDMERTFLSAQAANNGSGGAARRLRAALNFVTTNVVTNAAVTEVKFRELLTTIYKAGGKAKVAYVSPETKASFTTFTGGAQKNQDAKNKTVYGATDIYVSDFGSIDVEPSLYLASTTVLVVDPEQWAMGQLRKMKSEVLAKTGDAKRTALVSEVTLISKSEKGNGVLKPA